jgi:predicted nucleic acid-binding protein
MPIDSCLVDTNILLRIGSRIDPLYPIASRAIEEMKVSGVSLFFTHQNIAELWNVMTRPASRNGLGLSVKEAEAEVLEIEAGMALLAEKDAVYRHWRTLLLKYNIHGVKVHDARLIASMLVHKITHILTFNTADFRRYSEIRAFDPSEIGHVLG